MLHRVSCWIGCDLRKRKFLSFTPPKRPGFWRCKSKRCIDARRPDTLPPEPLLNHENYFRGSDYTVEISRTMVADPLLLRIIEEGHKQKVAFIAPWETTRI